MATARRRSPQPLDLTRSPEELADEIRGGEYTHESLLEIARSLVQRAQNSVTEFMTFLRAWELSGRWADNNHVGTWENFLVSNNLPSPENYRRSILALETIPRPAINCIGLPASKQAVRIPDENQRNRALETMIQSATDSGQPISERTARTIVAEYIHPIRRTTVQGQRVLELEAENALLRRRIQELETLVESLGGDPRPPTGSRPNTRGRNAPRRNRSQNAP